jgi:2-dehydro-3-deoxyphosphogalactonate aldolase
MMLQDALAEAPVIAIIRGVTPDEVAGVAEALYAGGVRVVEAPLNSPDPLESISRLKAFAGRMVWGAGTVLTPEQVDAVAAAGGQIVVSPNTDPAVIRRTVELGLASFPGFGSASEAFAAIKAGARELKLFPASTYGTGHLAALKAVLPPDVRVHPVGGVKPEDMAGWWKAGAGGFGLGSEIYKPGRALDEIERRAKASVAAVRALMQS